MQETEETAAPNKRGHKAKHPPRVPAYRRIPRLSNVDFGTQKILQALDLTETDQNGADESDANIYRGVTGEHDVHKNIREVVAVYCADKAQQIAPAKFRSELRKFHHRLETVVRRFPAAHSVLTEALDRQLDLTCDEPSPDQADLHYVEDVRRALGKLLTATEQLREAEGGAGRDGDRAKHQLIRGLSVIFEDHTKEKAKSKFWIDQSRIGDDAVRGPFPDFVKAVNDSIPRSYRIVGLEVCFEPWTNWP